MSDIQTIAVGSLFYAETKISKLRGYRVELENIGSDGFYLVSLHEYLSINEGDYITKLEHKFKFKNSNWASCDKDTEFDVYLNLTNLKCLFFRGNKLAEELKKFYNSINDC